MTDLDHALSQIAEVRAQLAASTRFRGFAPQAVAATGLLAGAAAVLQTWFPDSFNDSPRTFVLFWTAIAAVASAIVGTEAVDRSRRAHGAMWDGMLGGALRTLLPVGIAGAAITFVLWKVAPDTLWLLPGLWQILIALAGFAAMPMLSPEMRWAGLFYLVSGTVCLVIARDQAPLAPWLMGAPFGVGQLAVAFILHWANGTSHG